MKKRELDRRQFTKLTAAALGGMVSGTMIGCGGGGNNASDPAPNDNVGTEMDNEGEVAANDWTSDTHVCRGLNACMNKGAGENDCAGKGACATAKAHSCHEENDCKYQGGCGESVGQNACKGKGECAVPLGKGAWKKARDAYEATLKGNKKTFGEAPPAKEG